VNPTRPKTIPARNRNWTLTAPIHRTPEAARIPSTRRSPQNAEDAVLLEAALRFDKMHGKASGLIKPPPTTRPNTRVDGDSAA
jgi:hypothetical protein